MSLAVLLFVLIIVEQTFFWGNTKLFRYCTAHKFFIGQENSELSKSFNYQKKLY